MGSRVRVSEGLVGNSRPARLLLDPRNRRELPGQFSLQIQPLVNAATTRPSLVSMESQSHRLDSGHDGAAELQSQGWNVRNGEWNGWSSVTRGHAGSRRRPDMNIRSTMRRVRAFTLIPALLLV